VARHGRPKIGDDDGNGKTSLGVAPENQRWAVAISQRRRPVVANSFPIRTRIDSWRGLRPADTTVRVLPREDATGLDEAADWPERTDAHVGGSREGYAFAVCLRCKLSFTWRYIGR
jgi:hypothetical protein